MHGLVLAIRVPSKSSLPSIFACQHAPSLEAYLTLLQSGQTVLLLRTLLGVKILCKYWIAMLDETMYLLLSIYVFGGLITLYSAYVLGLSHVDPERHFKRSGKMQGPFEVFSCIDMSLLKISECLAVVNVLNILIIGLVWEGYWGCVSVHLNWAGKKGTEHNLGWWAIMWPKTRELQVSWSSFSIHMLWCWRLTVFVLVVTQDMFSFTIKVELLGMWM